MGDNVNSVFERNVLLKMRRIYSMDETVAFMSKRIAELEFKIGEQNSEIEELKHLAGKNKVTGNQPPIPDHIKKDGYVLDLRKMHKKQMEGFGELKKRFGKLQNEYFSLLAKYSNQQNEK